MPLSRDRLNSLAKPREHNEGKKPMHDTKSTGQMILGAKQLGMKPIV